MYREFRLRFWEEETCHVVNFTKVIDNAAVYDIMLKWLLDDIP